MREARCPNSVSYGEATDSSYMGGNKPNWPKSEAMSQNVQERVILPFLICDVVLPITVAVLPVGGMVPPEGVVSGPVCAPPPAFQCVTM